MDDGFDNVRVSALEEADKHIGGDQESSFDHFGNQGLSKHSSLNYGVHYDAWLH